jgi:hypothetical protein
VAFEQRLGAERVDRPREVSGRHQHVAECVAEVGMQAVLEHDERGPERAESDRDRARPRQAFREPQRAAEHDPDRLERREQGVGRRGRALRARGEQELR